MTHQFSVSASRYPRTLHATFNPEAWKGERLWIVALYGEIAVGENKLGALKREIVAEITP